jgi:Neurotransmitter-gated ion-channel transmembrane region
MPLYTKTNARKFHVTLSSNQAIVNARKLPVDPFSKLRLCQFDEEEKQMLNLIRITIGFLFLSVLTTFSFAQEAGTPATPPAVEAAPAVPAIPAAPAGPAEVSVGVYVNDIQQLDLQTHSYAMDFYVWLRWKNPDTNPSASLEYMNPFQLWGHIATPLYEAPQDLPDGSKYTAIRYQGQFNSKLPLEKYPFDQQTLIIEFEDNSAGAAKQVFVPDVNAITLNPDLTLPGYILGKPTLTVSSKPYPTNFGDTRLTELEPYSRVTVSVPVKRPAFTYAIKVIMPIFLVAACAALVFWIHPSFVEGRIGMGITALLTLVALQLTSNSQLPEVDYLMMIDLLYITAYIFVIASLAQVVRTTWAAFRGDDDKAIAQDRTAFAILGSLFLATFAYIMFSSLST